MLVCKKQFNVISTLFGKRVTSVKNIDTNNVSRPIKYFIELFAKRVTSVKNIDTYNNASRPIKRFHCPQG